MDYKEKYEETLRKAKEYYANVPGSREFLDNIFPQLSESEDEKIRKEIIEYFHGCIRRNKKSGFRVEQIKGWIAYLEKQKDILGERAKNITANMLEDGIEGIQRELIEFLSNTVNASWVNVIKSADAYAERIRNIIEKQKEQNPAEWSDEYPEEGLRTRFAIYTYKNEDGVLYLSNVFIEEASRNKGFGTKILQATEKVAETIGAITIRLKVKRNSPANDWYRKRGYKYLTVEGEYDWLEKNLEYMKPSKPAEWSEEDEESIVDTKCALYSYFDEGRAEELYNWLKSLRPQPKAELTLLDENIINAAVAFVEQNNHFNCWRGIDKHTVIKALRSLKPHWKPSEEQMCELNWASKLSPVLESLYNDLKKLM